ncbi:MAG: MarP family serine protease [Acidimicrobiales bacterium]
MSLLDVVILGLFVAAAIGGYRLGLLMRAASWLGLALGVALGLRLLPGLGRWLDTDGSVSALFVAAVVLIGGGVLGQLLGALVGSRLRRAVLPGAGRTVDRGAGVVSGVAGVALAVWFLTPTMLQVSDSLAGQVRGSALANLIDDAMPDPPRSAALLGRLLGGGRWSLQVGGLGQDSATGPPPAETGLEHSALKAAKAATVQIEGTACANTQTGTGFALAPDLVITNAHVVAGEAVTNVIREDGRRFRARPILFDSRRDLALLTVVGLDVTALELGEADEGDIGAVLGYPEGKPLAERPFRIERRTTARSADIYEVEKGVEREVFVIAADVRQGDSGGPLVNAEGKVVGLTFAVDREPGGSAFALTYEELEAVLDKVPRNPTAQASTGGCLRR